MKGKALKAVPKQARHQKLQIRSNNYYDFMINKGFSNRAAKSRNQNANSMIKNFIVNSAR